MPRLLIVLFCCYSFASNATHFVSVTPAKKVESSPQMKLRAVVDEKIDGGKVSAIHNYRLTVKLPKDVSPDAVVGDSVNVLLPVIRNNQVKAKITEINNQEIKLSLVNQVQQLEGQTLTTEIPLKANNLYLVPAQSIYSPRGHTPQVFILDQQETVKTVPVEVLQVKDSGQVLVSSSSLQNSQVVFRGLDNLISGDAVKVVATEEKTK